MMMTSRLAMTLVFLLTASCSTALLSPRKTEIKNKIALAEYQARRGNYKAAISGYENTLEAPSSNPWRDQVLYALGCLYAAAGNPDRDFNRSLACFRRLRDEDPQSAFNSRCEVWLGLLEEIVSLEDEVRAGRAELEKSRLLLEQESARLQVERREHEASRSAEVLQAKRVRELEGLVENQKASLESLELRLKKMKEIDIEAEKRAKRIK